LYCFIRNFQLQQYQTGTGKNNSGFVNMSRSELRVRARRYGYRVFTLLIHQDKRYSTGHMLLFIQIVYTNAIILKAFDHVGSENIITQTTDETHIPTCPGGRYGLVGSLAAVNTHKYA